MCHLQPDLPDPFLHRLIDDLTAVRALATLARHTLSGNVSGSTLAHLEHLDLIVMESATRIQNYRMQRDPVPLGVSPVCAT